MKIYSGEVSSVSYSKWSKEHHVDLTRSFIIGDKLQDIEAGYLAVCKTVLISSNETSEELLHGEVKPDVIVSNFIQAIEVLLTA